MRWPHAVKYQDVALSGVTAQSLWVENKEDMEIDNAGFTLNMTSSVFCRMGGLYEQSAPNFLRYNPCFDVDLIEDLSAVSHYETGRNLNDLGCLLGG